MASSAVRSRDRYLEQLLALVDAGGEGTLEERAEELCRAFQELTEAGGTAVYLESGSSPKKMVQAGENAEVTGPGVVRDLLLHALNTDTPGEAVQGGRFLMSYPIPGLAGGAILLFWGEEKRPGATALNQLALTARLLAPVLMGLQQEKRLSEVQGELRTAQQAAKEAAAAPVDEAALGEEHHLASVGRLAAGVAHELNTPLGAVLTMVSSLLRKEEDPNKKKRLSIVNDAVVKCRDIINKLLVYSRSPVQTETGLTFSRFVRAETDLNAIISGVAEMMNEECAQHNIEIATELEPDLPAFRANGTQWSHVFTNLVGNARDVLREAEVAKGRITITTSHRDGRIVAAVTDNGPGVPEAHRGKLFEPFFTTKEVGRGTGLGLAICREIVRKHHGELVLKDAPGGGASFEVTIDPSKAEAETRTLPKEQYP